ncbi:hypothetical protein Dimus_010524, partial [Dionaea muscipula]
HGPDCHLYLPTDPPTLPRYAALMDLSLGEVPYAKAHSLGTAAQLMMNFGDEALVIPIMNVVALTRKEREVYITLMGTDGAGGSDSGGSVGADGEEEGHGDGRDGGDDKTIAGEDKVDTPSEDEMEDEDEENIGDRVDIA